MKEEIRHEMDILSHVGRNLRDLKYADEDAILSRGIGLITERLLQLEPGPEKVFLSFVEDKLKYLDKIMNASLMDGIDLISTMLLNSEKEWEGIASAQTIHEYL